LSQQDGCASQLAASESRVLQISESLRLKKGESVTVETWNNGLALARQFVVEARRIGALPIMIFEDEDTYVDSVKNAPKNMVGKMGRHEYELLAATDAYLFIPNELLGASTKRLTPEEVDQSTSYGTSWYEAAGKAKLRGARMSFGFAGKEVARILGKRLEEINNPSTDGHARGFWCAQEDRKGARIASTQQYCRCNPHRRIAVGV